MRKEENNSCKFGSLIMCILFYVKILFPTIGDVVWDKKKSITKNINEFINQIGDNFETIMDK